MGGTSRRSRHWAPAAGGGRVDLHVVAGGTHRLHPRAGRDEPSRFGSVVAEGQQRRGDSFPSFALEIHQFCKECFDASRRTGVLRRPLGMILFGPCHFGHSLPTNRLSRHASSSSAGCRSEPLDAAVAQEVRACVLHSCFDAEGVAAVAGGSRWPRSSRASVERRAESSRSARTRSRTAVTGGALGTT